MNKYPIRILKENLCLRRLCKTTSDGTQLTIDHTIDNNGKRLRLALAPNVEATAVAGAEVELKLNLANQAFKLVSGSQGTVALTAGALLNASYTADPVATKPLFKLGKLFQLSLTDAGKATALVSEGFLKLNVGDVDVTATGFELANVTTNQTIQRDKVKLTLTGDVSAFKKDASGNLLNKAGANIGWKAAADGQSATAVLGAGNLAGGLSDALNSLGTLYVAADNAVPVPAVNLSVKAEIEGDSQATYNYFKDELADLFIITRDGMKFDTITTGSTSSNTIHIRDVSKILPAEGGKIFVTITEYAAHDANGRGEGTVLVTRKPLSVTLPSGGAVTLKPADVAADVGAAITAGRQARFLFEVETNQGEVAVKKSNAEGVDIQNGTRGTQSLVDFTL
ncbi:S-layer protein [Aeromonas hydrophila]|nr:S-layer protein [Aeromonas hydrophila]MDL5383819.1 S-layer protein [Aeromonas hydrophila]